STPRATNERKPARNDGRLMPSCTARSRSAGKRSPGRRSPRAIKARIRATTCSEVWPLVLPLILLGVLVAGLVFGIAPLSAALSRSTPNRAMRIFVTKQRFRFHRNAVAWRGRRHVSSIFDYHRVNEMFVQMVNIFKQPLIERATHANIIKNRQVLHVFAQAHATGM